MQTGNEGQSKENRGFCQGVEVKRADAWVWRDRTHRLDMEECLEMDRGEDLGICRTGKIEERKKKVLVFHRVISLVIQGMNKNI